MQKSLALPKEVSSYRSSALPAHAEELNFVSSCRRAQLYSKRSAHAGAQLYQLMQESSALSAHAEELNSTQRGQLMQDLSTAQGGQLMQELNSASSCRRAQIFELKQKSSALLKEVS